MQAESTKNLSLPAQHLPLAAQGLKHFLRDLEYGYLSIHFDHSPSLHLRGHQDGPHAHWHLHQPAQLLQRVLRGGIIGFAEGFHEGDWSSPDVAKLLHLGALNMDAMEAQLRPNWFLRQLHRLQHLRRPNSKQGSRKNIAAHYDLGNDFYRLWLDESMSYSSALFTHPELSLAEAQEEKYARLLGLLDANPGEHILEIGCGWGGFAEHAAQRGLQTTGITLSSEQLKWSKQRLQEAGLADKAQFSLIDYRDQSGEFDHIVSIEMFEAVGEKYWPSYFQSVYQRLKPGGRAAIQVIVIAEKDYPRYRREPDYIQLYIFPGGMLPTQNLFVQGAEAAGLRVCDQALFGLDYAQTLAHWRAAFEARNAEISELGYDPRFCRMWSYYLAYCEAAFRAKRCDLLQIVLEKPL